jgi:septal ring factor EnvC (AmiA/AmiB activator)
LFLFHFFLTESLSNRRDVARSQITSSAELFQVKDEEGRILQSKVNSLEIKCSRLRDFIKKLTLKCDEWEASYEKQAQAMDKLQTRDARTRERAGEIADRYRKLVGSLKRKHQVRTVFFYQASRFRRR